jgi:hypothetical protein
MTPELFPEGEDWPLDSLGYIQLELLAVQYGSPIHILLIRVINFLTLSFQGIGQATTHSQKSNDNVSDNCIQSSIPIRSTLKGTTNCWMTWPGSCKSAICRSGEGHPPGSVRCVEARCFIRNGRVVMIAA